MDVDLGDITLHVRDQGTGIPVVLLHGWPDTGDLWRHQVPALTAAGYRVIAPDLRGFGGSGKPASLAAYSAPSLVGDVTGLLDTLGVERAHLVGHDWGAAVAWWTAALVPDRVVSVTALSVGHPASFRSAGWRQRALTASLSLYRAILTPESLVEPPAPLPPVTVPAMGVWSSGDFALVEEGMTGSARYVTGPWRYERVDGAGHWLPLDAPGKVNALLLDFLGQQGEISRSIR
jgi:pimeloyl-ACP methyl ester carboxylesterase